MILSAHNIYKMGVAARRRVSCGHSGRAEAGAANQKEAREKRKAGSFSCSARGLGDGLGRIILTTRSRVGRHPREPEKSLFRTTSREIEAGAGS